MKIKYAIAVKKTAYDDEGNLLASGLSSRAIYVDKLSLDQKKEMHDLLPEMYTEAIEKFNLEMENINVPKR